MHLYNFARDSDAREGLCQRIRWGLADGKCLHTPGDILELPFVFTFLKTYSPQALTELMPEEVRIPVLDDSLCSCTVVESFWLKGLNNNNNIFRQKYSGT